MVEPDYPEMNESIDNISLYVAGGYNFAVETPRGSQTQNARDAETGVLRAKKLLAVGFAFPFSFGFLGSTQADEGDPLKVLLPTDADLAIGSLLRCRVLGGTATQKSSVGPAKRNNRLMAVPLLLHQDDPPYEFVDMPPDKVNDVEDFFVACQAAVGKAAKIVGHLDKSEAQSIVREAVRP
ncbi:inorganic diphosphatase [Mesorhizobium sp. M0244]|uniref:inorganic diphosphatase n=1 Tax=Mesorhizobium sp. M0244 TaxID=2956926 RepID=UPI00333D45E1